jgi:hypothetical protein
MADNRVAELAYSKDYGRLEVTVPYGTKAAELGKIWETLFSRDIIGKLPRGCTMCHSGDHFLIRERLEHVIRVDLDKRAVIGP